MEFIASQENGDASAFHGDTLVVPTVSYANLGQLTVDLVVNTLLHHAKASNTEVVKIGHLFSTAMPPMVGAAAFGTQDRNALCLNLEVYRIPSHKVTFIQQRTDVTKGHAREFATELTDWALTSGFKTVVVLAGADDMLRHDPNMQRRSLHTFYANAKDAEPRNLAFLKQSASLSDDSAAWEDYRGCGLAPLLHSRCIERTLPFVALVLPCAEGDNVPDAMQMAAFVLQYLEIPLPTAAAPSPLVFPPSWSQLFGRGPDVSLFM
ncbi:hypothetical protein Poli38472_012434 [Pythium oligandrum]|uniref:Proteasome assembly chaperone 2 n=1 Tax=Pythium oligandrum TaxID=41045 RepID=A0A8K1FR77_PYTOL|nr:hypothetical protein Poli38472_012434 [Pythium oligandrum]|eukprot:TMW67318.1 hypothetical protein Poli38472_012434 [Pythium oligandrum]